MLLALPDARLVIVGVLANILEHTLLKTFSLEVLQRCFDVLSFTEIDRYNQSYPTLRMGLFASLFDPTIFHPASNHYTKLWTERNGRPRLPQTRRPRPCEINLVLYTLAVGTTRHKAPGSLPGAPLPATAAATTATTAAARPRFVDLQSPPSGLGTVEG